MIGGFVAMRETVEVPVNLEIEQSPESFHAYAVPEYIDIREGDIVQLHGAPTEIGYGEILTLALRATVVRSTWWERRWIRVLSMFQLTELYEVGFQPILEAAHARGEKS